jgi:hypothetical protein
LANSNRSNTFSLVILNGKRYVFCIKTHVELAKACHFDEIFEQNLWKFFILNE